MNLISVIVPVYNVEQYLSRCLESILAQSYSNLEIILVDDGSTDSSSSICDQVATRDQRITVIHKKNGGLSDARNEGLRIAKGDYITFIDSDDWVENNYVESLLNLQKKYGADLVIGENRISGKTKTDKIKQFQCIDYSLSNKDALIQLFHSNNHAYVVAWGKLYKKDLLANFLFPIGKFHEDEFTTYKLFYKARKICYTNKIIYNYFQRTGNITSTPHPFDLLEAYENTFLFFNQKKDSDLTPFLFQRMCWQILYTYTKSTPTQQKSLINKISQYRHSIKTIKLPFLHSFLLKFFFDFPNIYLFFRNNSPFLIRKDF